VAAPEAPTVEPVTARAAAVAEPPAKPEPEQAAPPQPAAAPEPVGEGDGARKKGIFGRLLGE
jgi:hypothetical protein